jgi:hypothetical protein
VRAAVYNFRRVPRHPALSHAWLHVRFDPDEEISMSELSTAYFAERIAELRRDWPLLIADADIGQRLFEEVAGLEEVMRDLLFVRPVAAR